MGNKKQVKKSVKKQVKKAVKKSVIFRDKNIIGPLSKDRTKEFAVNLARLRDKLENDTGDGFILMSEVLKSGDKSAVTVLARRVSPMYVLDKVVEALGIDPETLLMMSFLRGAQIASSKPKPRKK